MKGETMDKSFDIQAYMTKGVERVVGDIVRATFRNPRESAYMARFALFASRWAGADAVMNEYELDESGLLIHRFRRDEEWLRIFEEADELGISFILLAGGEPMIRRDVIEAAGRHPNILFPVFTNGTFMDERYFGLLDRCRNLIPVMSIEGEKETTDARRGEGVYARLIGNMDALSQRGLVFGASVTVTTQNIREVSSDAFLKKLSDRGCKAVIFVEFVPVTDESADLAPGDAEREYLSREIERLREEHPEMVYISFPGDEKSSGGCVAAGRGFFHINSHGGAEPCPFSPYSDMNVRDTSLREALRSPLFRALQNGGLLEDDHAGGCVLYEKRAQVEALLNK